MRAERKWREVKRGGWGDKVTEMLKDERGGGEIISRYKLRERETPWSNDEGASTDLLCSSPAQSKSRALNAMKIAFKENNTVGSG